VLCKREQQPRWLPWLWLIHLTTVWIIGLFCGTTPSLLCIGDNSTLRGQWYHRHQLYRLDNGRDRHSLTAFYLQLLRAITASWHERFVRATDWLRRIIQRRNVTVARLIVRFLRTSTSRHGGSRRIDELICKRSKQKSVYKSPLCPVHSFKLQRCATLSVTARFSSVYCSGNTMVSINVVTLR